jgi:hypothetical protein
LNLSKNARLGARDKMSGKESKKELSNKVKK